MKRANDISYTSRQIFSVGILLWFALLTSCTKKEYMPPEAGEKIPYTDSVTISLKEALAATPYTLFVQAWNSSNMDGTLSQFGDTKTPYTLLVPDDQTFTTAGWTKDKISAATPEELDTLLLPYVLQGAVTRTQLEAISGSYYTSSVMAINNLFNKADNSPYTLKMALRIEDGKFSVNGISTGVAEPIPCRNGTIWPIGSLVEIQRKSAWDLLEEDGRFTLYTGITRYTDSLYNELFYQANEYYANSEEAGFIAKRYYRNSPEQLGLQLYTDDGTQYFADNVNTWFIPTDEAFRKAGFNNLDDLIAFNNQRGMPDTVFHDYVQSKEFQTQFYAIKGCFATDSMLDYHSSWGMRLAEFWYWEARNAILLFSNDLRNSLLADFPVGSFIENKYARNYSVWPPANDKLVSTVTHTLNNPLEFPSSGHVRVKGGAGSEITFSGPGIYTLTGVVHIVDDLFFPKGVGK
ncbi:MAG: fasciclin domain-containing protein [Chitinophagaceae bacterium]|nr:fasciclin domain-containing protein [Chitinophagaceae bacterium]